MDLYRRGWQGSATEHLKQVMLHMHKTSMSQAITRVELAVTAVLLYDITVKQKMRDQKPKSMLSMHKVNKKSKITL